MLDAANELPMQIRANLRPDLVMRNQSVPRLEQGEIYLELIQLQQLKELVENVGVTQKVRSVVRAVQQKRRLNILKHGSNLLLNLRSNCRRWIAVESG